jgi:phosphatidylserine synthase 2
MVRGRSASKAAPARGRSASAARAAPASGLKRRASVAAAAPSSVLDDASPDARHASAAATPPRSRSTAAAAAVTTSRRPPASAVRGVATALHPFLEEQDSPFQWLYKPHTVTGLFFGLALLLVYAFVVPESADGLETRRRGIMLASVIFLVYASINLRDSMLIRPHPIFWRVVHATGILYLIGLSFLLAFPPEEARGFLRVFDPKLGGRPAQNDALYAADCRVYTPGDAGGPFARITECIDIFVIAHTLGWFGKALLLRDWRLGWLLSVLWELIEITFQKILPNFAGERASERARAGRGDGGASRQGRRERCGAHPRSFVCRAHPSPALPCPLPLAECWWDHYFIDVLLGNGLGLLIGMAVVQWLNLHPYDWTGRDRKYPVPMSPLQQAGMFGRQFLPAEFAAYEWKLVEQPRHLFAAGLLIVIMEMIELNAFFLKYVLYVPPPSMLNTYRLVFWFFLSLPATREYYSYATDPAVRRMGPNCWLAIVLMLVELMVCVKFGLQTQFPPDAGIPGVVLACWAVAAGAFLVWCVLKYGAFDRHSLLGRWRPTVMNMLITACVAAGAYLAYSQDAGWGYAFQQQHAA